VMPTYREAGHLPELVPEIFAQADMLPGYELWLLIVDDESPDDTAGIVAGLQARYARLLLLHGKKRGLGVAYQRGFQHAFQVLQPHLLIQMDGDSQHEPAALPNLIGRCGDGVGVVIGSRFTAGGSTPAFSRRRRWTSQMGNWLVQRASGGPGLRDYTSGFRCIQASLAASALAAMSADGLAGRGYAFQSSFLCELIWQGAQAVELPITFGQRAHDRSKLAWRDYAEFVANLRRLRRRRRVS
ncbi:MAG: glycosyltransferase, partial [Terriglobales bacterium]